jgi:hypothetical protein
MLAGSPPGRSRSEGVMAAGRPVTAGRPAPPIGARNVRAQGVSGQGPGWVGIAQRRVVDHRGEVRQVTPRRTRAWRLAHAEQAGEVEGLVSGGGRESNPPGSSRPLTGFELRECS